MASIISAGTTSGTAINISGDTSGVLQLATNGSTTAVTIDTSQNIGFNNSSPYAWNSAFKAACYNNSYSIANLTSSGYTYHVSNAYYNQAGNWTYINTNGSCYYGMNNGAFTWAVAPSGTAGTTASHTQVAGITTTGSFIMGPATTENGQNSISFSNYTDTASYGKAMLFNTQYSSTRNAVVFQYNSGTVGTIVTGTGSTSYNSGSDYRLKDNPQPLTGSGDFIDALQPKTWTWKVDGKKGVGFIAHEVQEVSPDTVFGEKDAIDAEGMPIIQTMEYGSAEFIANIILELQTLRKRVATLEAKAGI